MKKILSTALAIGITTTMVTSVYAADKNYNEKKTNGNKIVEKQTQGELFIGLIEGFENGKVKVSPLFHPFSNIQEGKDVYININEAEFTNGEVKEYPNGYLISIYYDKINETDKGYEIIANEVSAVEEDKVVTIDNGISGENIEGEVTIQNGISEIKDEKQEEVSIQDEVKTQDEVVEEKEELGFWGKFVALFNNIFSFGRDK